MPYWCNVSQPETNFRDETETLTFRGPKSQHASAASWKCRSWMVKHTFSCCGKILYPYLYQYSTVIYIYIIYITLNMHIAPLYHMFLVVFTISSIIPPFWSRDLHGSPVACLRATQVFPYQRVAKPLCSPCDPCDEVGLDADIDASDEGDLELWQPFDIVWPSVCIHKNG